MRYIKILILLLSLAFCLQGCANSRKNQDSDSQPSPSTEALSNQDTNTLPHLLDDYLKAIENGVPSDMSLTLYDITPCIESLLPITKDYLMNAPKTVIDSSELSTRIDYLKKIDSSVLLEPKKSFGKDLRIYYYIETETDGIVLEVEISGIGGTIFVNGVEVKYNSVFFDLVSPYLDAWYSTGTLE